MTILESEKDIAALREGGKILASVLNEVARRVAPGVAAADLDALAEKLIREAGAEPSFKNYKTPDDKIPYPASLCVSVNDEVVHGIPDQKIFQEGDVVGLDLGLKYKGFYTDSAVTALAGKADTESLRLVETAKKSLAKGISVVKDGARIGDIGFAVQSRAEKDGFGVVRKLVGHGLGRKVHEGPQVPNFGSRGSGMALKKGLVLAIEPMITAGDSDVYLDDDLWTWKTKDRSLAAHFEHTVIVTENGAEIITKL
ncbi:MAG: type I methionyl aminopeptidase [Candidatus Pacebacteria bacterium]|nr:type I methionyl aminopeptidase [Candidatus Paceibacterota bacterium]NUQ57188.1 type I methionyl aminopeptidase [Candidatus Paceibacter sp.]